MKRFTRDRFVLYKEESPDSSGSVKGNSLPPKGEDEWNRKQVQQTFSLAGVKSAKLYVERDQIGKDMSPAWLNFRVDRKRILVTKFLDE